MATRYWPLFELRITTPRLELRYVDDGLADSLATLAAQGIHDATTMPFLQPWTDAPSPLLERGSMQWYWRSRADWTVDDWQCPFAAIIDGSVVGMQGIFAKQFLALREVATGSWLGRQHQGRGIGTEMRHAVLHLAFIGLRADHALSGAWHDNHASQRVSERLGYTEAGRHRALRRGEPDWMIELRLPRATWERYRRDDITVHGLEGCLDLFGLGPA